MCSLPFVLGLSVHVNAVMYLQLAFRTGLMALWFIFHCSWMLLLNTHEISLVLQRSSNEDRCNQNFWVWEGLGHSPPTLYPLSNTFYLGSVLQKCASASNTKPQSTKAGQGVRVRAVRCPSASRRLRMLWGFFGCATCMGLRTTVGLATCDLHSGWISEQK